MDYKIFTNGDYNLNIIGVRTPSRIANSFDDEMHVCFKQNGQWVEFVFPITTDPGTYYFENPMNVKGTAILVADQYRSVYKIDKHRGKYDALCQRNGKVRVYRDSNKDEILDHDPSTIDEGYFGINIHRSSPKGESKNVGVWSAGCQVFKNLCDYNLFMALCKKSAELYGDTFTYTLLEK